VRNVNGQTEKTTQQAVSFCICCREHTYMCEYFTHPIPQFKSEKTVCFVMWYITVFLWEGNVVSKSLQVSCSQFSRTAFFSSNITDGADTIWNL